MKKVLLATTAIVALGATSAAAAEWSAGVNGYVQIGLGFADDTEGVGVLRDGEIHFNASMTADNGITFRSRVELESTTNGDQIDENWASVGGSWGTIKVGGDDSAKGAYNNGVIYSPGARIGYYDGFGDLSNVQGGISGNSDAIGIHYDSPSFMGFRVGASYQPNAGTDGAGDSGVTVFEVDAPGDNAVSIGASYSGSFDDFGFGISAAYRDADKVDETWHVAGNVSAAGFTLAGGYEENSSSSEDYYIGARYSTGPWTVAGGYGVVETNGAPDAETFAAWVAYAVAPGVTAAAGIEHGDDDAANDSNMSGLAWLVMSF